MRIGVISDTHDRLPMIDRGLDALLKRGVQAVIHPGDIIAPFAAKKFVHLDVPLYVVYGNNDGEKAGLKRVLPQIQDGPLHIELGGRKILIHHFLDWCDPSDIDKAEIVITGHTHEAVNEVRDGRLMLNPGECCGWVNNRCTVALLDTDGPSAQIIDLERS